MGQAAFPKPVAEVVSTIAEIFRHGGRREIVELLESAHARFDETNYDNWNGGTYTWALRLEVSVALFASLESRLTDLEKEITSKLGYFSRLYPNDHLAEVTISPVAPGAFALGQRMAPSEHEVRRLWPQGRFRFFLSHVSKHKVSVSKLKDELWLRGIAAFVAHQDIEPSLEWRDEIELALRSMHGLAALLTSDFHSSAWTDQEVGWALGRGVLVMPVQLGAVPYGLAGKFQGVSGSLEHPGTLAGAILNALLKNEQTHGEMRRALVAAFSAAESYVMAQTLRKTIVTVADFTDEEKALLRKACTENKNVANAHYVPEAIYAAFGGAPQAPAPAELDEEVPF